MPNSSRLFTPIKIGRYNVQHRVILAPLTRCRVTPEGHIPLDIVAEYYDQRSRVSGSFLISEGTIIAEKAAGAPPVFPGIWSEEQIAAWKEARVYFLINSRGAYCF